VRVVLLGGTGGIGRALARRMAERGDRVFLLGRHPDDLARSAADLAVRAPGAAAGTARCDLLDPAGFEAALDAAEAALGGLDCVVVTAASFDTQERLEADPALAAEVLGSGFTGTVLFCEAARRRLLAGGGGTLCAFSSVAGDRARKPVVLYGAAKAGLSYYLDGLDVRFRAQGLRTVCVRPGFVRTAMTAGLRPPPFASDPEAVARAALRAIDRGRPVVYVPGIWRAIMAVIRVLPRAVRRRLSF
jgi:decaprenylphospho-beta-D-erythro-pentofuranosid-2-ulose 2-reductase